MDRGIRGVIDYVLIVYRILFRSFFLSALEGMSHSPAKYGREGVCPTKLASKVLSLCLDTCKIKKIEKSVFFGYQCGNGNKR